MKKLTFCLLFALFLSISFPSITKAQTIKLLAGNSLNGAMNGVILGGASMALANTSDFDAPLRVGLGLGTLYGIGMGGYDITTGKGNEILVSGLFNDGNNSSIIVLLDTFYGAAAGSIIVTAVMLVANEPIVDGLQYGAGIGAWVGFGFGVFDTFVLAKRTTSPLSSLYTPNNNANGFVGLDLGNRSSLAFINPSLVQTVDIKSTSLYTKINPAVDLVNFRINF